MNRLLVSLLLVGSSLSTSSSLAFAGDDRELAIKKDRKQIEGRWNIISLVVSGNEVAAEEIRKYTVINQADGAWSLQEAGKVISKGTSTIDPTRQPKTLDFKVTEGAGEGKQYLGIYELDETTRKMCFAPPDQDRPTEFRSADGSKHICVKFKRQK